MIRKIAVKDKNGVIRVDEIGGTAELQVPFQAGSLTYNGTEQSPVWQGWDPTRMIMDEVPSEINAGRYTVGFQPREGYRWADGTTERKRVGWEIKKAASLLGLSRTEVRLEAGEQSKTIHITYAGFGEARVSHTVSAGYKIEVRANTVTVERSGTSFGQGDIYINIAGDENHTAQSMTVPVTVVGYKLVGVEWDGSSSTKWTRTDGAVGLAEPVAYMGGALGEQANQFGSPFDELMPWAGMKYTQVGERVYQKVVRIPKFWYKLTQTDNADGTHGLRVQISGEALAGFHVSPAHMDRGDGFGERDAVYVGRYHSSFMGYYSQSSAVQVFGSHGRDRPERFISHDFGRKEINRASVGEWRMYTQMDLATYFTLWLLYIVEYADWNIQKTIGKGCGDGEATDMTGYSDYMIYHTGTIGMTRNYGCTTQYRYIEGLWENVMDWCDGCRLDSEGNLYVILNPNDFSETTGGVKVGKISGGRPDQVPTAFEVVSPEGLFPMLRPVAWGDDQEAYSCNRCAVTAGTDTCLAVGASFRQTPGVGILSMVGANGTGSDEIGSRMLYLPMGDRI